VISLGIFFRLYLLDSQIAGGDEFPGVRHAATHSYSYILNHFNQSDNCIPLTMYYKFLLQTSHLSEWGLRSLPAISGILLLILCPIVLKSLFKKKVLVIFLVLLAVSPLLIYYSRFGRPYSIVVLLSFLSIFAFYNWIRTKKKTYAGVYCLTAALAPYFSLFSFPVVAAPLIYTFVYRLFMKNRATITSVDSFPKIKNLILLGVLIVLGISLWLLPTIDSLPAITAKISEGSVSLRTLTGTLHLFNGTTDLFLSVILSGVFIYGFVLGIKKENFLFGLFLSLFICHVLTIIIIKPSMVQSPLVLARYSISCLSIWLLVLSYGFDDLFSRIKSLLGTNSLRHRLVLNILVFLFFAIILFANPMLRLYVYKSNFMTHHDFINPAYKDLDIMIKDQADLIPRFYFDLKEEAKNVRIIEAPPLMKWAFTSYHLYQEIHKKRVTIGYSGSLIEKQASPFRHRGIRFKNYFDMDNIDTLKNSDYKYVIIHHDILKETLLIRKSVNLDFSIRDSKSWEKMEHSLLRQRSVKKAKVYIKRFKELFGNPYFRNSQMTVFRIK
jgi:hypothetical protein